MLAAIQQVGTLIVIVLIGVIASKVGYLPMSSRKKLSDILLNIVGPLYAIKSFQLDYSQRLLGNILTVGIAAMVVIGGGFLIGLLIWRKAPEKKRAVLQYATGFPNCGYLGYPLIGSIFGDEGVIYVAIFVMIFIIYLWTLGVRLFSKERQKWYMIFARPALIGVIIGLIFFLARIKLPVFLYNAFSMVGSMTGPLAMLLIGAFLAEVHIGKMIRDWRIYVVAFVRFVVVPVIMFFTLQALGVSGIVFATIILIASMPSAINTVLFATKFDANAKYASSVVALTTILFMLTLPVWLHLCGV